MVALSTIEVDSIQEYVDLSPAVSEWLWIRGLPSKMKVDKNEATTIFEDNQSTISLVKELRKHQFLCQHIDIKYNFGLENI